MKKILLFIIVIFTSNLLYSQSDSNCIKIISVRPDKVILDSSISTKVDSLKYKLIYNIANLSLISKVHIMIGNNKDESQLQNIVLTKEINNSVQVLSLGRDIYKFWGNRTYYIIRSSNFNYQGKWITLFGEYIDGSFCNKSYIKL
jgi:hypothetical protein